MPPPFQLFTSLRYDPLLLTSAENSRPELNFTTPSPFYMLTYHRDRMLEAAQHFSFDPVVSFLADGPGLHDILLQRVKEWQEREGKLDEDGPLKVRVLFDVEGEMGVDFLPIPAVPLTTLYPVSFDPPKTVSGLHPAQQQQQQVQEKEFRPSPLTGGALHLGPTDSLPAGDSSVSSPPPQPKEFTQAVEKESFTPSPLTGGALTLGTSVTLPAGNKDPTHTPSIPEPPHWTLRLDTAPTPRTPFTLLKTTHRTPYDKSRARALPENAPSAVHREVILWNNVREVTEGTLTSLYLFRGGRWVTPPVGVPCAFSNTNTVAPITDETPREGVEQGEGGGGRRGEDADAANPDDSNKDEGELRAPFPGRWGHSVRSAKVGAGGQRGTSRRWALGKGFCMEETVDVGSVAVGEGVWVSNGVSGFGWGVVVA